MMPGLGLNKTETEDDRDLPRPAVTVKRFAELSPSLYRGAVPSEKDIRALKDWGITSIVDFQAVPNPKEAKWAAEAGLKYIHVPWTAHLHRAMVFNYIHRVSIRFLEVLSERKNLPVYVHCYHGRERTGTMIAVYRMAIENWSYEKAREEMLGFGVNKWLHFNLFIYLRRFRRFLDRHPAFADRFLPPVPA